MRRGTLSEIKPNKVFSLLFLAMALFFTACDDDDDSGVDPDPDPTEEPTGSFTVDDQFIRETGNTIIIDQVTLSDPSWVVVRRDNGNNTPVTDEMIAEPHYLPAGTHDNVEIQLNEGVEIGSDERIWLMLYADTGQAEEFEYDGTEESEDQPIADAAGAPVMVSFVNTYSFAEGVDGRTYPLQEVDGSGVNGTATFYPAARGEGTYVVLNMEGTQEGGDHPAHIRAGAFGDDNGEVVITLNNVEGGTAESVTFVDAYDDGTAVSFDELSEYEGHITVAQSPEDETVVAQGDIGAAGSPFTATDPTEYELLAADQQGVVGTVNIRELEDGSAWVELELDEPQEGVGYTAEIRSGTVAEGGEEVMATLNPVQATTGRSYTRLSQWDDGTAVNYETLNNADAYINVQGTGDDTNEVIGQADIGQNVLTGETQVYQIDPAEGSEVSGTLTFSERRGGGTLAEWYLENVPEDMAYDAGIYQGALGAGGRRVIGMSQVRGGADGIGRGTTSIRAFDTDDGITGGGDPVTYSQLREYEGHASLRGADGAEVAGGNIGPAAGN